ncbi:hypothetical protein D9M71_98640 [compost metagenome]
METAGLLKYLEGIPLMARHVPYGTRELELLKTKLSGILSRPETEVVALVKQHYAHEVIKLVQIFEEVPKDLNRKWMAALLAQVASSAWRKGPGGEMQIDPGQGASARYLSLVPLPDDAVKENKHLTTRKQLFERLLEKMPAVASRAYRPMLHWVQHDELGDPGMTSHPLASDTLFGHNLNIFEELMQLQVAQYERQWLRSESWPSNIPTPCSVTRECSQASLGHFSKIVQQWLENGKSQVQEAVPDSLLALTSANLSVNRVLLEIAAVEARNKEAADLVVSTLQALNDQGVTEVPILFDGLGLEDGLDALRTLFKAWFGYGGSMLAGGSVFTRPMNDSDIENVLAWSQQIRDSYIRMRGRNDPDNHRTCCHLFIFCLPIIGAFYLGTMTAREFAGKSNSRYSVFPGRALLAKGKAQSPGPHANYILMLAYGMIFHSNAGWNLFADCVRDHATTTSIKRSHIQQLVRFATKNRTPRELLVLHNALQKLRERKDEVR